MAKQTPKIPTAEELEERAEKERAEGGPKDVEAGSVGDDAGPKHVAIFNAVDRVRGTRDLRSLRRVEAELAPRIAPDDVGAFKEVIAAKDAEFAAIKPASTERKTYRIVRRCAPRMGGHPAPMMDAGLVVRITRDVYDDWRAQGVELEEIA